MTNLQLLLSIVIPCLVITLSMLSNNAKFSTIEKPMDKIDSELRDSGQSLIAT